MDVSNMPKRELIPLLHILEWIHFWWENQEENHYPDMPDWQNQEWCEEFAGRWYRGEEHDNPRTVAYSAGVYDQQIDEDTAIEEYRKFFTTEELRNLIRYDYESFYNMSGRDADEFLPSWY